MFNLWDKTCNIIRISPSTPNTNNYNRPTNSTTTLGPYPCYVGAQSGSEIMINPQMAIIKTQKIYMPSNADVKDGDIIEVIGDYKYIVQNVRKPRNHHTECHVRIQKET